MQLREIGVRFSMDDFGTGYSSLAYLTKLPLDQLKIDQSFVHNIGLKTTDAVIVQTIIGMANNLGMEVIAEGVETEAQRIFLGQSMTVRSVRVICSVSRYRLISSNGFRSKADRLLRGKREHYSPPSQGKCMFPRSILVHI